MTFSTNNEGLKTASDNGVGYQITDTRTNRIIVDEYVSDLSYPDVSNPLNNPDPTVAAAVKRGYDAMNQNIGYGFALIGQYGSLQTWKFQFKNINAGWF